MTRIRQRISGTIRDQKGAGHFADLRTNHKTSAGQKVEARTSAASVSGAIPGSGIRHRSSLGLSSGFRNIRYLASCSCS